MKKELTNIQPLINDIKTLIENAKQKVVRTIDNHRVMHYWEVGQRIFEEEQQGTKRAEYAKYIIKNLSKEIKPLYGSGYSVRQLELMRQFYRKFPNTNALRSQLNWFQYKLLIRISDEDKRGFYIAESIKNSWTGRELERQINSSLFERLLLSSNKKDVLAVTNSERLPQKPSEIIKDPMCLEFLGLEQKSHYYERDLEQAIITNLQSFLLELGNGFSFVSRQQRIHLDGDDFFIDLVFYNRLLQCHVLFEIKTHRLTHQDMGQLQMYVNYYDREIKLERESPTIGVLLCSDKNDAVVKYSLPKDNETILASKYELYLPTEDDFKRLLKEKNL